MYRLKIGKTTFQGDSDLSGVCRIDGAESVNGGTVAVEVPVDDLLGFVAGQVGFDVVAAVKQLDWGRVIRDSIYDRRRIAGLATAKLDALDVADLKLLKLAMAYLRDDIARDRVLLDRELSDDGRRVARLYNLLAAVVESLGG